MGAGLGGSIPPPPIVPPPVVVQHGQGVQAQANLAPAPPGLLLPPPFLLPPAAAVAPYFGIPPRPCMVPPPRIWLQGLMVPPPGSGTPRMVRTLGMGSTRPAFAGRFVVPRVTERRASNGYLPPSTPTYPPPPSPSYTPPTVPSHGGSATGWYTPSPTVSFSTPYTGMASVATVSRSTGEGPLPVARTLDYGRVVRQQPLSDTRQPLQLPTYRHQQPATGLRQPVPALQQPGLGTCSQARVCSSLATGCRCLASTPTRLDSACIS